jgi:hypothetical protein
MSASVLRLMPGIFRSAAPRMILGQYSTLIDPLRFISLAVEAPRPMIFANSDAPPKASIRAEMVRGFSMDHAYRIGTCSSTGFLSIARGTVIR